MKVPFICNVLARERLARISIVKSEKARAVEDMLIRMVQSGQIRGKVTESILVRQIFLTYLDWYAWADFRTDSDC